QGDAKGRRNAADHLDTGVFLSFFKRCYVRNVQLRIFGQGFLRPAPALAQRAYPIAYPYGDITHACYSLLFGFLCAFCFNTSMSGEKEEYSIEAVDIVY